MKVLNESCQSNAKLRSFVFKAYIMNLKRKDNIVKKLAVLEVVKNNKRTIFGSFSGNKISATGKIEAWQRVLDKAKSLGLADNERSWTYARDSLLDVWKSRSMVNTYFVYNIIFSFPFLYYTGETRQC
jgi:hypothetical protein